MTKQIDLNHAAKISGIHRSSIFRAIQKGDLTAQKSQLNGHKLQYVLDLEEFEKWAVTRSAGQGTDQNSQSSNRSNDSRDSNDSNFSNDSERVHESNDSNFSNDSERVHESNDSNVSHDSRIIQLLQDSNRNLWEALRQADEARAELTAERDARARTERQVEALAEKLDAYRRVLTEQADSLAEERANRLAAELKVAGPLDQQQLKLDMPTPTVGSGWGSRVRRWLRFGTG